MNRERSDRLVIRFGTAAAGLAAMIGSLGLMSSASAGEIGISASHGTIALLVSVVAVAAALRPAWRPARNIAREALTAGGLGFAGMIGLLDWFQTRAQTDSLAAAPWGLELLTIAAVSGFEIALLGLVVSLAQVRDRWQSEAVDLIAEYRTGPIGAALASALPA
jgi:hypothetical protein